ncbi:helix-turn-helix domain-containing protein [Mobilibacterium timonense]|uniref:helix-turn-helix domain-containing protein n=1 Tax=Mobilibacterium timonense TaxID=1871012 RepID=UPI0009873D16|nr:helix-turn-helix domain-containing protein [Mobilibacterium timonense]
MGNLAMKERWIMDDKRELLTIKEMCEVMGISESTWKRNKIGAKLTPYKVGKKIKYRRSEIERFRMR